MESEPILLFFDYVDPLSYLVEHELAALAGAGASLPPLDRVPLELRPPPEPLLDPDDPGWRERWDAARTLSAELGISLVEPPLIPWTRKAHELVLHGREHTRGAEIHRTLFDEVFLKGGDIGRVDVLVDVARRSGLDPMEAKAVLDVDKHAAEVEGLREVARQAAIPVPPALVTGARTLRGFHNRDVLRTFLCPP